MSVSAHLGRKPCIGSSPVQWQLTAGVKPYEGEFDLRPSDAEALLKGQITPIDLRISNGEKKTILIEGIYALTRGVGENENIAPVLVVDRRWFWSHKHVRRTINIRRTVGSKRQKTPDTPPELEPLLPEISYAPFSLKDGRPWTARELLESVMDEILLPEQDMNKACKGYTIDPALGNQLDNLPIEDLEIDDPGDVALRRVLSYLPEGTVTVLANGTISVRSRADGLEEVVVGEAGPEIVGGGHVQFVSNHRIRPRKIHVLFTREIEVRFDFAESDSPTRTKDERFMDNVLPLPDYTLNLKSASGEPLKGNPVAVQGTWLSFVTALNSWGAPPYQSRLKNAAAWFPFIRKSMCPHNDGWTSTQQNGVYDPNADWMGRLGAIQSHYRRTFRINPRWMARIYQLKASRVATIDPTTGTRAPAVAWADYSRLASMRSIRLGWNTGQSPIYAMNVDSSPASATTTPTKPPAPADVSIADHDQGIIHIDLKPDIYRVHEMLLPSKIEIDGKAGGPVADINDRNTAIAFNALGEGHGYPELSATHRAAIVLTAIPAGDNNAKAQQLHRVTVKPGEAAAILPPALARNLDQAQGPELEIRINATIETARIAWVLDRREDIERAFGLTSGDLKIDDLVVNLEGDYSGGASLKAIAHAVAARTWAELTDRFHGSKTADLTPGAEVAGNIESVQHELTTGGATQTSIHLPDRLQSIDLFSLLPESTRRIVLRLAPSPGKAP